MSNFESSVEQGIAAVKSDNRSEGRLLLINAIQVNENHELAWLWLSGAVESDEEKKYCLERVLQLNPTHSAAQRGIGMLSGSSSVSPIPTAETEETTLIQHPKHVHRLPYSQQVRAIALSPNNLFAAIIDEDFSPSVWRISDKRCQWRIEDYVASRITYSPDGSQIAISSDISTGIFSASSGRLIQEVNIPGGEVVYSEDEKTLLLYDELRKEAHIVNVQRARKVKTIKLSGEYLEGVDYSNNGQYVAAVSANEGLWMWDRNGKLKLHLEEEAISLKFHPSNLYLAVGTLNNIHIVNVPSGDIHCSTKPFSGSAKRVCWSSNGSTLGAQNFDGDLYLFGHPQYENMTHYKGYAGKLKDVALGTFGDFVVVLNEDGTVEFWNL